MASKAESTAVKTPRQFRKLPVVIEAMQFNNGEQNAVAIWCGGLVHVMWDVKTKQSVPTVNIETLEGVMTAVPGDYVIKGVQGEFYPCKADIFEATYEEVLP